MIMRLCALLTALSLMLIASCGGGGGGGGLLAGGGIGGSGISNGTVTAFGSIFVNGVEFDTSNAIFTRGGTPAVESNFSVGEVVTVAGTFNTDGRTGTARNVTYTPNVIGAVTKASSATGDQINVLGQTVAVTPSTVFENFTALTDVIAGNVLEVSGFTNADGSVIATHITKRGNEFRPGTSTSQVRGFVTNLDEASMTFTVDGLTVDFSAPQIMNGTLANGQFVEVESDTNLVNGELAADTVNVVDPTPGVQPGKELNTEGVVSSFASPTDFSVGSQPVTTTADTEYEAGGIANLALDVPLEVNGQVDANGVLVARTIVFRLPENTFDIGGIALAVNAAAGTVTVQSADSGAVEVTTDVRTRFTDNSELALQSFGLADIGIGDLLQITAFQSGNTFTAIRLQRESSAGNGVPPPTPVPPPDTGTPPPTPVPPPDTGTPPPTPVPPPDTGTPPPAPVPPPDTGTPPPPPVPPPDTGTPPPPAPVPPPDTGTPPPPPVPPPDTGTPPPPAPVPPPDTGTPPPPDTGTPPPDTGTPPPDTGIPPVSNGAPPDSGGNPPAGIG